MEGTDQRNTMLPQVGYGYRRIAALLRDDGWQVNDKRIERLWRREGLKVPMKQPKKGRLWLNDGSCVRLRPEYRDHVWSYDFVHHRTDDGKVFRTLNILDEYSRECLAIRVIPSVIKNDRWAFKRHAALRRTVGGARSRLPAVIMSQS